MIKELNHWDKRNLTPFGKITVIKSLVLSKIVHILTALPSPSKKLINELNKIFYIFLWNDKPDKIKRSVMKLKFKEGGLGMVDVELFDKSLKLTWIRKLFVNISRWKSLLLFEFPHLIDIVNFGDAYVKTIITNIKNKFWKNVMEYLYLFMKNFKYSANEDVRSASFIFNSNILVGKQVIHDKVLINNNITFIYQLIDGENLLTYQQFTAKYHIKINFLRYHSITSAVRAYILRLDEVEHSKIKIKNFQPIF